MTLTRRGSVRCPLPPVPSPRLGVRRSPRLGKKSRNYPLGSARSGGRLSLVSRVDVSFVPPRQSETEERQNEPRGALRHRRRRGHGRGPALPPRARGLDRHDPRREGGADLRVHLARRGPDPQFHRRSQHGEGPSGRDRAVSRHRDRDWSFGGLARLRGGPPRTHRRRGRLASVRACHAQPDRRRVPHRGA